MSLQYFGDHLKNCHPIFSHMKNCHPIFSHMKNCHPDGILGDNFLYTPKFLTSQLNNKLYLTSVIERYDS